MYGMGGGCLARHQLTETRGAMRRLILFFLAMCGCAGCPTAQELRVPGAILTITSTIQKSGAEVGLAFRTLDGRTEWFLRADEPFHAASTMKVPVLIELYRQVRDGKEHSDNPKRDVHLDRYRSTSPSASQEARIERAP